MEDPADGPTGCNTTELDWIKNRMYFAEDRVRHLEHVMKDAIRAMSAHGLYGAADRAKKALEGSGE